MTNFEEMGVDCAISISEEAKKTLRLEVNGWYKEIYLIESSLVTILQDIKNSQRKYRELEGMPFVEEWLEVLNRIQEVLNILENAKGNKPIGIHDWAIILKEIISDGKNSS